MRKKKLKKPVTTVVIIVVLICILVPVVSGLIPNKNSGNTQTGSTEPSTEAEAEGTQSPAQQSSGSSAGQENGAETAKSSSRKLPDVSMTFSAEDTSYMADIQIGKVTVHFRSEDAEAGIGTVGNQKMTSILFHDGIQDDLKGYMFAFNADRDDVTIDTVEEAQDSVGEYIPGGSGIAYAWEETEDAFVRRTAGYDSEAEGAYLFFTIVPKTADWDPYFYSIVITAYEGDAIKESSYRSMMDAVSEYIPDSVLLSLSYEEACSQLDQILTDKTATGERMGGLDELESAHEQWLYDVYGVHSEEELNAMSEEEKADKIWKYKDPVGYRQAHGGEAEDTLQTEQAEDAETSEGETETETEAETESETEAGTGTSSR